MGRENRIDYFGDWEQVKLGTEGIRSRGGKEKILGEMTGFGELFGYKMET